MRRKRSSLIINLLLFCIALILIFHFSATPKVSNVVLSTRIRYESTSSQKLVARGICPGLSNTSKPALVVARIQTEDETWLDNLKDAYHLCVYTADAPLDKTSTHLQTPANRGHEAMGYLTFLIDNYDHIPAAGAVFVHGSQRAWHNDHRNYDNQILLEKLNVSAALKPYGYHNLRCDWRAGTCSQKEVAQGSFETAIRATTEPWNARVISDQALPKALLDIFGQGQKSLLGRGDAVRAQCCAQFVVSRERIWQHSKAEYVALRQWLIDGSSDKDGGKSFLASKRSSASPDDRIAGRVLSYVWHILFLPHTQLEQDTAVYLEDLNSMACPRADDCYCRLYGLCNLKGCRTPESCPGQYRLPPNYKLPDK